MDDRAVEEALYQAVVAAVAPTYAVALPNEPFEPGEVWVRPTYRPGSVRAASIGVDADERLVGILIVDVFTPIARGRALAGIVAAMILDAFRRGTDIPAGDAHLVIQRSYREGPEADGRWYQTPVIVEFRAELAA